MRPTNLYFANNDQLFKEACELAGIPTTARQASRYRRDKGKAFSFKKEAIARVGKLTAMGEEVKTNGT